MKLITSASFLSLLFAAQSAVAGGGKPALPEPSMLSLLAIGGVAVVVARYLKK